MSISLKANSDGTSGAIQVGGVDKVTIGPTGIATGSYAPSSITPTELSQKLTSGTAWTYTSGTPSSIDFTAIPSWVSRITITLDNISFAAAGVAAVRLGVSNTLVTTGYSSTRVNLSATPAISFTSVTDGIASVATTAAGTNAIGHIILTRSTGNQWVSSGNYWRNGDTNETFVNGSISLAGVLTNLSLVATTSTFDAGSINILYE